MREQIRLISCTICVLFICSVNACKPLGNRSLENTLSAADGVLQVEFRPMAETDVPAVVKDIEDYSFNEPWKESDFLKILKNPAMEAVVATANGAIVGYAVLAHSERGRASTIFWSLAVHPAHRGRNVGTQLLRYSESSAAERGSVNMMASLSSETSKAGAFDFLQKSGWTHTDSSAGTETFVLKFSPQPKPDATAKTSKAPNQPASAPQSNEGKPEVPSAIEIGLPTDKSTEPSAPASRRERNRAASETKTSGNSSARQNAVTNISEGKIDPEIARRRSDAIAKREKEYGKVASRYVDLVARAHVGIPPFAVTDRSAIDAIREGLLAREVGSVVILAEAGTGKTELVKGFAYEVGMGMFPEIPPETAIFEISPGALGAGTSLRGQSEERVKELTDLVDKQGKKVILFMDEVHSIGGQGTSLGDNNDFFEQIKPYLADGRIRIIGTSTEYEFNQAFAGRTAVYARFARYLKPPLTLEMQIQSVQGWLKRYDKPEMSESVIRLAIELSDRFDPVGSQPRKVAKLLDKLFARFEMDGKDVSKISEADIIQAAKRNYQVDDVHFDRAIQRDRVGRLTSELSAKFTNRERQIARLEEFTVQSFVKSSGTERPNFRLFFAGGAGTGKTDLAKAYAEFMGFRHQIIEMASFGNSSGKNPEDLMREIAAAVRKDGSMVLILDETDKASLEAQNRLINALYEGFFYVQEQNGAGDKNGTTIRVSMRNVKVIMTGNVGEKYSGDSEAELREQILAERKVSEYVLSRVQEVLHFKPIESQSDFQRIIQTNLEKLIARHHATAGNEELEFPEADRKRLINELVKKYAGVVGVGVRNALAELEFKFNSLVARARFATDGNGCEMLRLVFEEKL
jgi:ATP-dependent Clp protease ATP-binding subunit ClpA/ribosomal protein S18 acetylase RimI-like enzyme